MHDMNESIEMNGLTWRNWNAWIETNELTWIDTHELTWMNWDEWIEMNELTWRNWHEWIKRNELTRANWNQWAERNKLKQMNWHAEIERNILPWIEMNWHEWIETNDLKRMNWNEWIGMKQLVRMNWTEWMKWLAWHEWFEMKKWKKHQFLRFFLWSTAWWWCGWHMKPSSRYCLVHILSTSSSKSGPRPSVFHDFYMINYLMTMWAADEMKLWLQSCAHFVDLIVDLILKKWCNPVTVCDDFVLNRALATVSCTFCWPLSGSRRATAETKTLQRWPPTATLPEKNTGFCARECFQPWIHTFPIVHTSQLINYFMMMWLTWWCGGHGDWDDDVLAMMIEIGCHDGETASHWQSSVTRKFPN